MRPALVVVQFPPERSRRQMELYRAFVGPLVRFSGSRRGGGNGVQGGRAVAEAEGLAKGQRSGRVLTGEFEFGDGEAVEAEELLERDALGGCNRLVGVTLLDDVEDARSVCNRDVDDGAARCDRSGRSLLPNDDVVVGIRGLQWRGKLRECVVLEPCGRQAAAASTQDMPATFGTNDSAPVIEQLGVVFATADEAVWPGTVVVAGAVAGAGADGLSVPVGAAAGETGVVSLVPIATSPPTPASTTSDAATAKYGRRVDVSLLTATRRMGRSSGSGAVAMMSPSDERTARSRSVVIGVPFVDVCERGRDDDERFLVRPGAVLRCRAR